MNVSLNGIINGFGDLLLDHLRSNLPKVVPIYERAIDKIGPILHEHFMDRFTNYDFEVVTMSFAAYQTVRKVEYRFCDAASNDFLCGLRSQAVPEFTKPAIDDSATHLARDFLSAVLEEKLVLYKPKAEPAHVLKVYQFVLATHICPLAQELRKVDQLDRVCALIQTPTGKKLSALEKEWHILLKQKVLEA